MKELNLPPAIMRQLSDEESTGLGFTQDEILTKALNQPGAPAPGQIGTAIALRQSFDGESTNLVNDFEDVMEADDDDDDDGVYVMPGALGQ